ncbi:uncharacterized protein LOC124259900 [Haliotis rubra]|uniref:uncharacterized protein LOC124259900 n=1 Tax=Haliotis rubra TaxID=36100 RepID=UPI001EE63651|nr:uncharacterized protein LOC124259900 [Haliotis rubra]
MADIPWTLIYITAAVVVSLIFIIGCVCCARRRKRNTKARSVKTNRGNIKYQKVPTSNTLDLHGESVKSARSRVEKFLNEKKQEQRSSSTGRTKKTSSIITGKGNHSRDGRPVLKPVVEKQLRKKRLQVSDDVTFYKSSFLSKKAGPEALQFVLHWVPFGRAII